MLFQGRIIGIARCAGQRGNQRAAEIGVNGVGNGAGTVRGSVWHHGYGDRRGRGKWRGLGLIRYHDRETIIALHGDVQISGDNDRAGLIINGEHTVVIPTHDGIAEQRVKVRIRSGYRADERAGLRVFEDRTAEAGQGGRLIDIGDGDEDAAIRLGQRRVQRIHDVHEHLELDGQLGIARQQLVIKQRIESDR